MVVMDINEYLPMFLDESREHLRELSLAVVRVEEDPDDATTIGDVFRIAHSLKGMSATMGFEKIAALTHAMEDLFEVLRMRRGGLGREATDVLLECLDVLSATFEAIDTESVETLEEGPLVERLEALVRTQSEHEGAAPVKPPPPIELQAVAHDRKTAATSTVRVDVKRLDQPIPVEGVFLRFPRLVRDLSGELEKKVDLQLVGSETELDRIVVVALGDPLVHIVRNSLDHGLEPPEEREAAGKPPTGTLEISAHRAGGEVIVAVRDDGRGIDPARVASKAVDVGLIAAEAAAGVDLAQAVELLFSPGFSTAEKMTGISGRGVGLDAVRTTIRELGGEVIVQSELGVGTITQIRLPLTLAIVSTLLVEAQGQPFVGVKVPS